MGITRSRVRLPSPALLVACLALFAALGGTTYGATQSGAGRIQFTNAKLGDGWKNIGSGFAPAGYAKDALGVVHLRGEICCGPTSSKAFVLPPSMRPGHDLYFPVYTFNGTGSLKIFRNGVVWEFGGSATTSLDGISFVAGE